MSLFKQQVLACPACGKPVDFNVAYSVNADRRPDLREAVFDGTFQRQTCGACQDSFRLAPELNYLDAGRGQWMAVHPADAVGDWETIEAQDRAVFNRSYGDQAVGAARELGAGLRARVVFGMAAFREKLLAAEVGLDDVDLELLKTAILRNSPEPPFAPGVELRFIEVTDDGNLAFAWLEADNEQVIEMLQTSRQTYNEIADDLTDWQPLREQLSAGLFVDMTRLMTDNAG